MPSARTLNSFRLRAHGPICVWLVLLLLMHQCLTLQGGRVAGCGGDGIWHAYRPAHSQSHYWQSPGQRFDCTLWRHVLKFRKPGASHAGANDWL